MKPKKHLNAFFIVAVLLLAALQMKAQPATDANAFSSFRPYTAPYHYGVNQGYYGNNWSSQHTARLSHSLGIRTLRIPLYDEFLTTYGLNSLLPDFQYFHDSLGMDEMLAFIGKPNGSNRDTTSFAGATEKPYTFRGLYEPIWLNKEKLLVNPKNTYAAYLFDVVRTYGHFIRFWEIVNEPDFTYSEGGWLGDFDPNSTSTWFRYDPKPEELINLKAPVTHYIRMLRVSWEIIKQLQPDDYVCTGGIAYKSFLDALLRNSDNPVDGSVTADYPQKGGAYFDILSFHSYPMYYLRRWDHSKGRVVDFRHSDAAVREFINIKYQMDSLLKLYGYDHVKYPAKQFICTETGVARIMGGNDWGSPEGQLNFMLKAQVAAQKHDIKQLYWFQLGDMPDEKAQFDQMGLFHYFGDKKPFEARPAQQGVALKTMTALLFGKTYDPVRTAALQLPNQVDGGAFRGRDGTYVYVLWAKTQTDMSENSTASYSFPATMFSVANVVKREWNFSQTGKLLTLPKSNIALSATPAFFSEAKR